MDAVGQIPNLMSADQKNQVTRIVSELGTRLRHFIRARVRTEADAEDILQDVWERLIGALEAGTVEQISAWLYTVARNRIIDRSRKPTMASLDALAQEDDERGNHATCPLPATHPDEFFILLSYRVSCIFIVTCFHRSVHRTGDF